MTDEEHLLHLRHLLQALKLVADAVHEDQAHVTNALYALANAMLSHIEAIEASWPKDQK